MSPALTDTAADTRASSAADVTAAAEVADLAELAQRANDQLEGATPEQVLGWAFDTFGDSFVVAASMTDAVLIDMASRLHPGVPVIFVDTGYHFAETIGTRDAVVHRYDITLVNARPKQTVAEQDLTLLPNLYSINPDLCCSLRKVAPFSAALGPYSAWASGIRRDESVTRRHAPVVSVDRRGKVKVNPLVSWTHEDLDSYAADNDVIVNPLLHDGYPSIGCAPCTHRVNGGDLRSGRWVGRAKTECGLHS